MKTKTFRAPHMMAALEEVQDQFGPEAMILSVRQVTNGPAWKPWQGKSVEVVAVLPEGAPEKTQQKACDPVEKAPAAKKEAISEKDIHDLISRITSQLDQSQQNQAAERLPRQSKDAAASAPINLPVGSAPQASVKDAHLSSETSAAFQLDKQPLALQKTLRHLCAQGLEEELRQKLIETCAGSLPPRTLQDPNQIKRHLSSQIEASIRVRAASRERVVCLIGASGSGKTSTAAKIAARTAHEPGKKVVWICADTVRAGAIAEARACADSLGIALRLVYTPADLKAAVIEEKEADLILVDMPSCNPYLEPNQVEMGEFLTALPSRATYWVVPATARSADLKQALAAFSQFNLYGLILTKMDETRTFGDFINLAWRSKLPLVYFSAGVRVVEDFKPAKISELAGALLAGM